MATLLAAQKTTMQGLSARSSD